MKDSVLFPLNYYELSVVTGAQLYEDWYVMRFGEVTRTVETRVIEIISSDVTDRIDFTAADSDD